MQKGNSSDHKVKPGGLDLRRRNSNSLGLWVVNRTWTKDISRIKSCGVMCSIVRSVYQLKGRKGKWVRYNNNYYPLHNAEEFSEILANAKSHKYKDGFFHNGLDGEMDAITRTEAASFIYCDESGPLAVF